MVLSDPMPVTRFLAGDDAVASGGDSDREQSALTAIDPAAASEDVVSAAIQTQTSPTPADRVGQVPRSATNRRASVVGAVTDGMRPGSFLGDYGRMTMVGTVGFATDFGVFNALVASGWSANSANGVALVTSGLLVFLVNLRWTYGERDVQRTHRAGVRFVMVAVASVLVNWIGFALVAAGTSSVLVWNIAKFLLTIATGFGRFAAYREWVYR